MTSDRDFDRLARAWLELGPTEAPDRAIAAVLQATESAPQVRRPFRWSLRRSTVMNRLPLVATVVAALAVVIGGGLFLSRSGPGGVTIPPSPSPTAVPSATPGASSSAGQVPPALASTWVGPKRTIAGMPAADRYRFILSATKLDFPDDTFRNSWFVSDASEPTPGELRLVASGPTTGCQTGDEGRYAWSLSPGGVRLTLQAVSDACPTRLAALAGEWTRVGCTNTTDACFGNLEAGTFASQYFTPQLPLGETWHPDFGALTYTVPADWANSSDWPTTFSLTPSADYALETPDGPPPGVSHGIFLFANPAATIQTPTCANKEQSTVPKTVDGLIGWIRGRSSLVSTAPTPITIDGHTGAWIDLKRAPTWTATCPDPANPTASQPPAAIYLSEAGNDAQGWGLGVAGSEQQRLIILDLGVGGHKTIAIAIDSTYPDRYDDLVAKAMPIVESFTFK